MVQAEMRKSSDAARPIFPGSHPPSIFGTSELNFRVRNGNGWDLAVISTAYEVFKREYLVDTLKIEQ